MERELYRVLPMRFASSMSQKRSSTCRRARSGSLQWQPPLEFAANAYSCVRTLMTLVLFFYVQKGSGAHSVFQISKKTRFQVAGGTFDHGESESGAGLVWNRCSCSRTAKTGFWPNQDLVPSSPRKSTFTQKLPYRRNFVRRFRICNQKHDSSPQSRDIF